MGGVPLIDHDLAVESVITCFQRKLMETQGAAVHFFKVDRGFGWGHERPAILYDEDGTIAHEGVWYDEPIDLSGSIYVGTDALRCDPLIPAGLTVRFWLEL